MDKLLIIADDFTGALDTGIQFTKMGVRTHIVTAYDYDLSKVKPSNNILSANTDTRPQSPEEAYRRVYTLAVNARKIGFQNAYKKTDSGLRGNIGIELKAAMDAYGQNAIAFIPALPTLNRITRDGIEYIDGIPVKDSVFGADPFEPVTCSNVADIIHLTSSLKVVTIPRNAYETARFDYDEQTVVLFNAETVEDLSAIARVLKEKNAYTLTAGCAGFASVYEEMLCFEKGNPHLMQKSDGLLALVGSVNKITVNQISYAGKHGFAVDSLTNPQKLGMLGSEEERKLFYDDLYGKFTSTDRFLLNTLNGPGEESVIDFAEKNGKTLDDIRFMIADNLGVIAKEMVERGLDYTFSMTGGDTLMGFMKATGVKEIAPICEIGKGAVLAAIRWNGKRIQVISKSGGFGEEDIFLQMYDRVMNPAMPD